MSLLQLLLVSCIFSALVNSQICSYYQEIVETGSHWKCNVPLKNVTSLFVTDFPRSRIPVLDRSVLQTFIGLTYIHIGKCDIETVAPDAFTGLPLTALYLNDNKIKKIEKGTLSSLDKTTSLEITFNQLEALEKNVFMGMKSLVWMSLSANKISTIENGAFNGLEQLDTLFLASNEITTLESDTFTPLQKLSLLDISHNHVVQIPSGMFTHFPNMQKLLLEHNQIEEFPNKLFDNLTALSTLDISQNKITKVQDTLFGKVLENFFYFKIYSNKISRFNATNFFIHAPRIKEIELYNNPWNCAELERLKGEFMTKKVFIPIPVQVNKKPNVDGIACVV